MIRVFLLLAVACISRANTIQLGDINGTSALIITLDTLWPTIDLGVSGRAYVDSSINVDMVRLYYNTDLSVHHPGWDTFQPFFTDIAFDIREMINYVPANGTGEVHLLLSIFRLPDYPPLLTVPITHVSSPLLTETAAATVPEPQTLWVGMGIMLAIWQALNAKAPLQPRSPASFKP